jgi:hypothetical protein
MVLGAAAAESDDVTKQQNVTTIATLCELSLHV